MTHEEAEQMKLRLAHSLAWARDKNEKSGAVRCDCGAVVKWTYREGRGMVARCGGCDYRFNGFKDEQ